MTNTKLLNNVIASRGLKKSWLAQQMGLSAYGLALKINNRNQFNAGEIQKMCNILGIIDLAEKDSIFFANSVDKLPTVPK